MRSSLSSMLVAASAAVSIGVPVSAAPAQADATVAAGCTPRTETDLYFDTDGKTRYGGFAFCVSGRGYIRVSVKCTRESDFKKYTANGPRVWSAVPEPKVSTAWCFGGDAMDSVTYILG